MDDRSAAVVLLVRRDGGVPSPGRDEHAGGGPTATPPRAGRPAGLDPTGLTADITHPDWPVAVGDRWVHEQVDDGRLVRTEITVPAATLKVAYGLRARVVHDLVTADGVLVADTLRWYAQDAEGNVWHLGEQTVACATGRVVSTAGSWEAGVDDAEPGLVLPRTPGHGSTTVPDGARRSCLPWVPRSLRIA
jgi:hypothetical protein